MIFEYFVVIIFCAPAEPKFFHRAQPTAVLEKLKTILLELVALFLVIGFYTHSSCFLLNQVVILRLVP